MKPIISVILKIITTILITLFIIWLFLPVLSLHFLSMPLLVLVISFLWLLLFSPSYFSKEKKSSKNTKLNYMVTIIVIIASCSYMIIALIASTSIFTWKTKKNMLNIKEVTQFDKSVPNVDMDNLIILDESDALKTSEKLITEKDPSLGSKYQIGIGTLNVINGKPYWIFPLEYRGFFKWQFGKNSIPGYLKVSATNFNDAEFVDYNFKASPTGFLQDDVHRIIYSKYKSYGLTDYSFEVDEEGKGWWVVTAYSKKNWISTKNILGTIIVDPVTKNTNFYNVNSQPKWVERVYPVDIFDDYLDWYGKYVKGWWNPSDTGKLQDTEGKGYVFKEGKLFFYTGLTSVGKDAATTGFVVFDPRSGEAEYNRISGSTEMKAVGLMEELVQNAGYTAKYPYLININGEPTYFSTLKGKNNNVVGYSFASVTNYKAVTWGKNLREAQTNYNRVLLREGGTNQLSSQTDSVIKKSGIVSRIGTVNEGYYIIKLIGIDKLFLVSSEQFPLSALTKEGDNVEISYLEVEGESKIDALDFVNKDIK